jgi:glycosyltransferase involved in cell wall biosynthesis
VVHTHSLKSGLYGSLAARLARVPSVWHLHDRLADDYLPARAVALMQRAVRLLPTTLVANSRATLETVPRPPRGGARVVPNPVPATASRPARDEVGRIGMIGRLAPWKGQTVFLEAFARAFPGGNVTATIVGAPLFGEEAYEAEVRALVARLGIEDRVEFRGFRTDVGAELDRLDVVVHASVVPEPFGQVIVEAMAAGVPVAASAGGGASEIATEGQDALLHPPGDVEALAGSLAALASDPGLRARLAAAGRTRAAEFGPEPVARGLEAVYAGLSP